ncbi:MAG TPA: NUDIX hydrolase, partial [Streptomyces sp.]|nr:NUDIX hydrolase [Streptomyces sp.]
IRCPDEEIAEFAFFSSARAAELMSPLNRRVMLAALRARLGGTGAVYLDDGRHVHSSSALDRHQVHVRPCDGRDWTWHPDATPPEELPLKEVLGWLFVPDGRVVLTVEPHPEPEMRIATLPGGTVEGEDADPVVTLVRESVDKARLGLDEPAAVGWLHDTTGADYGNSGPCARLRVAAPVTRIFPASPDLSTGRTFIRLLAAPERAAALLGLGESGHGQASLAAKIAGEEWGIPPAAPGPVTEVPAEGMVW